MSWQLVLRLGAIICGLAVVLGAFGAHALEGAIDSWYVAERAVSKLESWETAVRYQMFHGLGLIGLACVWQLARSDKFLKISVVCFLLGTLVFSGGLYLWVLTDLKPFVIAVPLGGLAFIIGWVFLALCPLEKSPLGKTLVEKKPGEKTKGQAS